MLASVNSIVPAPTFSIEVVFRLESGMLPLKFSTLPDQDSPAGYALFLILATTGPSGFDLARTFPAFHHYF